MMDRMHPVRDQQALENTGVSGPDLGSGEAPVFSVAASSPQPKETLLFAELTMVECTVCRSGIVSDARRAAQKGENGLR